MCAWLKIIFFLCLELSLVKLKKEDAFLSASIETGFLNTSTTESLFYWLVRHNSTKPSN